MAELAKNPINEHYKGLPCMIGEVVGRIIGEADEGSWAINENGDKIYSIPLLCTPHGSIIKTGRFYLDKITEEGMKKLEAYENELKANNKEMYVGRL